MRKTAFITGGATGIGRQTVIELSKEGYFCVVFCNKSEKEAIELCNMLNKNNEYNCVYFKTDITNREQTQKAINDALKICPTVDLLVNNAAIAQQKLFCDITFDDWDNMMNTNINSMFTICKSIVPIMLKQHYGKIINISSIWGINGASMEVHYSASKAAVIGFTKALAKELAPSGITVNCVAPGVIDTKMNSHLSDDDIDDLIERTPLCRLGTPKDIADCITFLASDKADFITGQTISPNGGIF